MFNDVKTIAIIGLSDNPERYSYKVASYLKDKGFKIIPINPNIKQALGEKSFPTLLSVPQEVHIDLVDVFRRSEEVFPHVTEAIKRGDVKIIWMQQGILNYKAEEYATENGIKVVMDSCLMIAHKNINF